MSTPQPSPSNTASQNNDTKHNPLPRALFHSNNYPRPLDLWAKEIQDLGASDRSDYRIQKISHRKRPISGDEHLRVHLQHPSGRKVVIDAGRMMMMGSPYGTWHAQSTGARDHVPSNMRTAHDRVNISHGGSTLLDSIRIGEEVLTLSFPNSSKAPNVAHCAALFLTLRKHGAQRCHENGRGAERASAWFAYSGINVLKELFGGTRSSAQKCVESVYEADRVHAADRVDALVRDYSRIWEDFSKKF